MRRSLLPVFFFLTISFVTAQKFTYHNGKEGPGLSLRMQDSNRVVMEYSIRSFELAARSTPDGMEHQVVLPGHFLPNDPGAPDLPGYGRYIAVPRDAIAVLHLKKSRQDTISEVSVTPAPVIPRDDESQPPAYCKDQGIYALNAFYPAEPFKLSGTTRIRGIDAVILGITPFQYNPVTKKLIVYYDIELEIEFIGGSGRFGEERLRNRWWDPVIRDLFLNAGSLPVVDYSKRYLKTVTGQQPEKQSNNSTLNTENSNFPDRLPGCDYLIIVPDHPDFIRWADSIRLFRTMQGILTEVVTLAEIGGNNTVLIEDYIDEAYETWDLPPAAILLMADDGTGNTSIRAPVWGDYCASDHIYGDVDFDDEEEIVMARMTARNAQELEVMVRKAIDYESSPPADPGFYHHPVTALGWQTDRWFQVCSESIGGFFRNVRGKDPVRINDIFSGDPDSDPWTTTDSAIIVPVFNSSGLGYIPDTPQELGGWTGGNALLINEAINNGAFLIQHRDHGFEEGWGEPYYWINDIDGLTNTDLTFFFSVNCLTGKFNWSAECFAEKLHRYTCNGQPAGALGVLAASETSYSFVNDTYVWGVYDHLFPDFFPDTATTPDQRGEMPAFANTAGKLFLKYNNWPYNQDEKEVTYNLFHHHGDAFTCLFSEVPQDLAVSHNEVLVAGETTFSVEADSGSYIAVSSGGQLIGTADGTGMPVQINILPQYPPAFIDIIVTRQNCRRYHSRIPVIPPEGPFVIYSACRVIDSSGNQDGLLDYGEYAGLEISVKNIGTGDAGAIEVWISSEDPLVVIDGNYGLAGAMPAGATVLAEGAMTISIQNDIPDGHVIPFSLTATDGDSTWTSYFTLKAHSPKLVYAGLKISDPDGNNNGRLDPGETADISVSIKNAGTSAAYGIQGVLETEDPYVILVIDSAMHGDIMPGDTIESSFRVSSMVFTPSGHEAFFDAAFDAERGISAEAAFSLNIGLFPILVVDLDNNADPNSAIVQAVEDWGVGASYANEIPENPVNYKLIFLCLGTYSQNHTLQQDEAALMVSYLENGGNLYMEGGDTWSYDPKTPLHPLFHITGIHDGYDDLSIVRGLPGTFTGSMYYSYTGDKNYIDRIAPEEGSTAFTILENANPTYDVAVAFEGSTYRTIGASFEFAGLANNSNFTRKDLILKYLEFYGLEPVVDSPGMPAGPDSICQNDISSSYSITPVSRADYYVWELSPAAAGTLQGWDTIVTVNWAPGFAGTASLSVRGMNSNGIGPASGSLEITVNELPSVALILSDSSICTGDTTLLIFQILGKPPFHMELMIGGMTLSMDFVKPHVNPIPLSPVDDMTINLLSISDGNGCMNTGPESIVLMVFPHPNTPGMPTGPTEINTSETLSGSYQAYSSNASSYQWYLAPDISGTVMVNETDPSGCTIEWNESYAGQAVLEVAAENGCGASDLSPPLYIGINSLGVKETGGMRLLIYPNPVDNELYISSQTGMIKNATITFTTMQGRVMVMTTGVSSGPGHPFAVPTVNLTPGLYILTLESEKETFHSRIIIK